MYREYVESTMIASVGYDSHSGTLEIEFKSSLQVWQYYDVSEYVWNELRTASSIGKYFNAYIRNQYRENRVA